MPLHRTFRLHSAALASLLALAWPAATPAQGADDSRPRMSSVGNLSVSLMLDAWGSPLGRVVRKQQQLQELAPRWIGAGGDPRRIQPIAERAGQAADARNFAEAERLMDEVLAIIAPAGRGAPAAAQGQLQERAQLLDAAQGPGPQGVEDYLGWAVVEPREGQWNWDAYKDNARAIRARGQNYIPFVWMQNLPGWVRDNRSYVFAANVETGLATEALSIFAPQTRQAYDRFFKELRKAMGSSIDILRIGSPYDFGETAFPANASDFAFPMKNVRPGFWVHEAPARQHFAETLRRKYRTVAELNQAWGSQWRSFDAVDYPQDARNPRAWLDFVRWYHEGFTEKMGELVDTAKNHFPTTPININLGFPFEKINLGQDISGLAKMAGAKGIRFRSPTGPMVPFLYTKRVATAANFYRTPVLSSEPADGSARLEDIALMLFKDLSTGVSWHFDYPGNLERGKPLYEQYRRLPLRSYPVIDCALLFPTTSHYLDNWKSWRQDGYTGGFPAGLREFAEETRDALDYDVVDERLVEDGALARYRILVWPSGKVVEGATLARIRAWVEDGGTLLVNDLAAIRDVAGEPGAFAGLRPPGAERGFAKVGRGSVFDARGDLSRIRSLLLNRGDLRRLDAAYPVRLSALPPIDSARDGVLASIFADGILLFNPGGRARSKSIALPDGVGPWDIVYARLPAKVELPPMSLRWIDGRTGAVR